MLKILLSGFIAYCLLAFISLNFNILSWHPEGRAVLLIIAIMIYALNESLDKPKPIEKRITPTLEDGA